MVNSTKIILVGVKGMYNFLNPVRNKSYVYFVTGAYSRKEEHPCDFAEKGQKKQNIWKFGQKCTKFENILKIFRKSASDWVQLLHVINYLKRPRLLLGWVWNWPGILNSLLPVVK